MGDQHQRGVVVADQIEQQFDDLLAGVSVQVARRLVGQQQAGLHREGTGQRHALLFATRQLTGIVGQAVTQADLLQCLGGLLEGVASAGQLQWHRDVFECRHGRYQVEVLKDDTDPLAAEAGQRILVQVAEVLSVDRDASGGRAFQPRHHHHHRGLAGARGADHRYRLAARDVELEAAQDLDRARLVAVGQHQVVQTNHRLGHGVSLAGRFERGKHERYAPIWAVVGGLKVTSDST